MFDMSGKGRFCLVVKLVWEWIELCDMLMILVLCLWKVGWRL